MKKIFDLKLILIFSVLFGVTIISCDDEVTLQNRNELNPEIFFENLSQLESGTSAMYNQLGTEGLYQRFAYVMPDAFSDENVAFTDENFRPSYDYNLTAAAKPVRLYWQQCYIGISNCNFILDSETRIRENVKVATSGISKEDADNAIGEAHFMRGLYYFLLVRRYGGVPLVLTSNTSEGTPRSTKEATYDLIVQDFEKAAELLYPKGQTGNGRATKGAAYAFLGKVHLFRENYVDAKTALSKVTGYSLLPKARYTDNFNESGEFNQESIFEVNFTAEGDLDAAWDPNSLRVGEGTFHAQEYSGWGNLRPSKKLIAEFEADDTRLQTAVLLDGQMYGPNNAFVWNRGAMWYKFSQLYENRFTKQFGDTNTRILRYADVLLMQAEVEHKLNNDSPTNGSIFYLNEIRKRIELPLYGSTEMDNRGYPVNTTDEIFNAIVHERIVELCGEQHRYDDLVRWDLDAQELEFNPERPAELRNYNKDIHRLIPIPQDEIDRNLNLGSGGVPAQNPGY